MLLSIKNLSVVAHKDKSIVREVSFDVAEQSIVALVGGSGSGKTTTGLALLRLLAPGLDITGGEILFNGRDLVTLEESEMRVLRGGQLGMVFQEPLNAFNPVFKIGHQIEEVLCVHTELTGRQRELRVKDLLSQVEIDDPRRVAMSYPHQLSGGMRQRAMLAQAIAANPKLIIADEPTSNLDVTVQARILALFKKLRDELSLSILLITHDLGVVNYLAEEVVVMTAGSVVEQGAVAQVLKSPRHDYTKRLMRAMSIC